MTPRLLGVKEFGNLAHKMKKLSLDKTEDVVQLGEPRSRLPQVCYFGALLWGLDMQINVAILRKCTGLLTEASYFLKDSRSDGAGTLSFFRREDVRPHSVQNGRQDL